MTDAEIIKAVRTGTHVLVPLTNATNAITGHAPLDLSDIETKDDDFAVYIDGLTCDQAGALVRQLWGAGYPAPAPTI